MFFKKDGFTDRSFYLFFFLKIDGSTDGSFYLMFRIDALTDESFDLFSSRHVVSKGSFYLLFRLNVLTDGSFYCCLGYVIELMCFKDRSNNCCFG